MYAAEAFAPVGPSETRAGKGIPLIRQWRLMFLNCACPRIQGFLQLIFQPALCGLFFLVGPVSSHLDPWVCPDSVRYIQRLH